MKKLASIFCLSFLTMALSVSAFAQKTQSKDELLNKIAKMSQTKKSEDQDKAYQMSKDYLAQYGNDNDENAKKIKEFVEKYRASALNKKLDEGKTAEAFALGKEILAQEPENSYVTMNLAYGGYEALTKKKDKSFAADSLKYANQTLSLFEAGKLPKTFQPFSNQAEATALMYYIVGSFAVDDNNKEAAQNFYKALQYDSKIKNTAYPYYYIALNYEQEYAKAAKAFQDKYGTQVKEDDAMKAENAKLEKLLDRMLNSYARLVKIAQTENNPNSAAWKQRYLEIYKFVKQSDAGADEYLSDAASKPIPDPSSI
ncbi:MAG: hypothetical protein ABI686_10835 [Acidobacteriota bacterium]